jgi:phenylpropionate dioxygenase-like ring-hydroxylating dioxygenase large terminal subunit
VKNAWQDHSRDPRAFDREQAALGHVWTVVGLAYNLSKEGDWIRAMLGGRSIFVQRFKDGIRAFENRCAHRGYPLRTEDRGNGPVVCGFHHWRYNANGEALGIPDCERQYGAIPRDLGFRLEQLDVEPCGELLFARFRWPCGEQPSLKEYLGPVWEIIAGLTAEMPNSKSGQIDCASPWRDIMRISLDDYHIVAVHPDSFGKNGYLGGERLNYVRHGWHSGFFPDNVSATLADMSEQVHARSFQHTGYRIIHVFPNLTLVLVKALQVAGTAFFYVGVKTIEPIDHARSRTVIRVVRSPFSDADKSFLGRAFAPFEMLRRQLVLSGMVKILREDRDACEALAQNQHMLHPKPPYAAAEIRVGWFDEALLEAVERFSHKQPGL